MKNNEIIENEYAGYFKNYISEAGDVNLIEELEICLHDFIKYVQNIPMDKFDFRYAAGKWTIKELIQHLIDSERVFAYRALCFSRNDKTHLPGFDENSYIENTNANNRSLQDLLTEMAVVRQATLSLYKSFSEDQLSRVGVASNNSISVKTIGYIIIGHQKHHQKVFTEKYLN